MAKRNISVYTAAVLDMYQFIEKLKVEAKSAKPIPFREERVSASTQRDGTKAKPAEAPITTMFGTLGVPAQLEPLPQDQRR